MHASTYQHHRRWAGRRAATVATPLHWGEVVDELDPDGFTLPAVLERADPWAEPIASGGRVPPLKEAVVAAGYPRVDASPRGVTASYLAPDV